MDKYIDADKLLKRINEQKLMAREPAAKRIIGYINEAAAADVEPVRHGWWIPDVYEYYHCSECGFEHDEPERVTPYCPNCGANMEEYEEETT